MSTAARPFIERRRSTRLSIQVSLFVCGDGLQEQTSTFSLNAHGVLVALASAVTIGQRIVIQNPEKWAERGGRVIRLGRYYAGRMEVGIEFAEPAPDFWLMRTNSKEAKVEY